MTIAEAVTRAILEIQKMAQRGVAVSVFPEHDAEHVLFIARATGALKFMDELSEIIERYQKQISDEERRHDNCIRDISISYTFAVNAAHKRCVDSMSNYTLDDPGDEAYDGN
jgi:hypothetical protein